MEDSEFLTISNMFSSLDIIEKGIEKIYSYLLDNEKIENLKEVCKAFDLSLKRGYKICSVLNDLELVQIYDRPMKVLLAKPIVPIWQKIVNKKIEEWQVQYRDKKELCKSSLQEFFKKHNLLEIETPEPVEFVNFDLDHLEEIYYPFYAERECKIALGIKYENPVASLIREYVNTESKITSFTEIPQELKIPFQEGISKLKNNLLKINIQVIFNADLVDELLSSNEFKMVSEFLEQSELEFESLDVRITKDNFSNFNLSDNELIQPSFSPTNKLIGAYISRNKNIYQIFYDKFNELFEKGIPLNKYLDNHESLSIKSASDTQSFVLCIL